MRLKSGSKPVKHVKNMITRKSRKPSCPMICKTDHGRKSESTSSPYNENNYLVKTDYKANFWEIDYLLTSSKSVNNIKVCNHRAGGSLRKDGHNGHCR